MTGEIRTVSIDRYPDPACSYTFEESEPVVRAHNEQFTSISTLSTGDVLEELFETDVAVVSGRPSLDQTGRVWVRTETATGQREYLVRVIPPDDDRPGHLLFTEADEDEPQEFGVDRVASVISHDLRNPLDVARARLRAGRELDAEEHFDHVEQAHDRMGRIIQDVLTLARGEDVVTPEACVDLGEVAREAWQTVETSNASLTVEDELPTALADRDRVSRLFENLFRNSVEHGIGHNSRDRTITVTVGRIPSGFFVADDGIGIDESERAHIFEPGYSSDDHGTGLGLAIVARIADLHGWSVDVTDSTGGGARFNITGVESETQTT